MISLFRISYILSKKLGNFIVGYVKNNVSRSNFLKNKLEKTGIYIHGLEKKLPQSMITVQYIENKSDYIDMAIDYILLSMFYFLLTLLGCNEVASYYKNKENQKIQEEKRKTLQKISRDLEKEIQTINEENLIEQQSERIELAFSLGRDSIISEAQDSDPKQSQLNSNQIDKITEKKSEIQMEQYNQNLDQIKLALIRQRKMIWLLNQRIGLVQKQIEEKDEGQSLLANLIEEI